MQYLRQSTAATVIMGPFVDNADGVTPEEGLAAGAVDEIGVYKHDATALTDISGTTTFTHRAGGMYTMTLSTSDTGTAGRMTAYVRDDDVCLPVWKDFTVLPSAVYDSLMAGSDYLQVDAVQMEADPVWDEVIEAGAPANAQTARQMLRIALAALAGVDGETGDWSAKSLDGTKVRVSGTLSASGARESVMTLDGS